MRKRQIWNKAPKVREVPEGVVIDFEHERSHTLTPEAAGQLCTALEELFDYNPPWREDKVVVDNTRNIKKVKPKKKPRKKIERDGPNTVNNRS